MAVGVIYGAQSGIVRRVVAADDNIQFDAFAGQGEALLVLEPKSNMLVDIIKEAEAEIAQLLGKKVVDIDLCAVVRDDGTISHFIKADPLLDVVSGHDIVAVYDPKITAEGVFDKQTGLFTVPERKRLAGTIYKDPVTGIIGPLTEDIIYPGGEIAKPVEEIDP